MPDNVSYVMPVAVEAPCQDSTRLLLEAHGGAIHRIVRRRLNPTLLARVGEEDVVQDIWAAACKEGLCAADHTVEEVKPLLLRVAVTVTLKVVRDHMEVQKRDCRRECPLPVGLIDKRPSAEQDIDRLDDLEHDLARLTEQERWVVEKRLAGVSREDIAKELGVSGHTVGNILRGLEEQGFFGAREVRRDDNRGGR